MLRSHRWLWVGWKSRCVVLCSNFNIRIYVAWLFLPARRLVRPLDLWLRANTCLVINTIAHKPCFNILRCLQKNTCLSPHSDQGVVLYFCCIFSSATLACKMQCSIALGLNFDCTELRLCDVEVHTFRSSLRRRRQGVTSQVWTLIQSTPH